MDSSEPIPTRTLVLRGADTLRVRKCRIHANAGIELVSEKERIRVGSHPSSDLMLEDPTVSRHHFEVQHTDKGYLLVDLSSTNGTFLDGRRVERAYLSSGSVIKAGQTSLDFSAMDEEIRIEPEREGSFGRMLGESERIRRIFGLLRKVAPLDASVILQGETGTGKELAAAAIHAESPRRRGPFVVLDCGAISPNLIESELFGHEKGAFTGAVASRAGAFERALGGTIFLDEIGELRLDLQPKLLRVLESRELRRLGGDEMLEVDVRVISATNRDLAKEVAAGSFREDLFYRLSVIEVQLPPLRERCEDIPALLERALGDPEILAKHGRKRFTEAAMARLEAYSWPGNIRELMNVVSHVLAFSEGPVVEPRDLPPRLLGLEKEQPLPFNEHLPFKEAKERLLGHFEREYLEKLLRRCGGNVAQAARESGLHRKSIERLAKKYRLSPRALR